MKRKFKCPKCGREESAEDAPHCCGQRMGPLPVCTSAGADAEHARAASADEPCDDGR